jgi:MFS family permease
MSANLDADARREWRKGWPLALSCLAGMAVGSIALYVLGPLIGPIEQETGWSRTQITFGVTVSTVTGALLSPIVGMLLDRFGPRRVGLPGAALALGTLTLISVFPQNYPLYLLLWFVMSIGAVGVMPTVWTTAIASSFLKARGLAMAVALCGSSASALIMPLLSTLVIDTYGWRAAVPIINGMVALVVLPVLWWGLHSRADEKRADETLPLHEAPVLTGVTNVRDAVFSWQFFKIAGAASLFTAIGIGLVTSMVPVMTSLGFARTEAAAIAGLVGLASFVGRISTGFLIDRFNSDVVAGTLVLFPVISCLLLLNVDGSVMVASIAVFLLGLSLGAEVDVVAYLAAEKFGTARYGTIFGFINAGWFLATAIGPLLISLSYDMNGNYEQVIKIGIPLFLIVSLLLYTVGKPLPFDDPKQA